MSTFQYFKPAALTATAVVLALSFSAPSLAREQKEKLLYDVMFGGLHIADVVVSLDQSSSHIR